MFGYILPDKPELKIKDYEAFRAYYCGVCRSIGKRHGHLKRLTLSYDSAFLAVLLCAVANAPGKVIRRRCPVHPLSKRSIIVDSDIVDYASDINLLLAYYNLEDKKRDGSPILPDAAMLALKRAYQRIRKKYAAKCAIMEARLSDLVKLENEKCASMDMAAEPFAKLMEEITAYEPLCTDEKSEQALRWMGYHLGKWIYLMDAFDDLERDIKCKSYNPLLCQFQYRDQDIGSFRQQIRERVEFNLLNSLNQISKTFELLEIKINYGIIENIIYIGMRRKTEYILETGSCRKSEKSV